MELEAVLEQTLALLQRQGRISDGALQRRFAVRASQGTAGGSRQEQLALGDTPNVARIQGLAAPHWPAPRPPHRQPVGHTR